MFALGAVLVAAAGGQPFGEGTPMMLMYRAVHEPADLSALPEGIRPVVAACLAKDPARRPTPHELLDLLAPVSAAKPTADATAHPPTEVSPATPSPTPTAMSAAAPTAGNIADAATVGAAPHNAAPHNAAPPAATPHPAAPHAESRGAESPPGRMSTGRAAAVAAGALLVLGGAGYGIYAAGGPGWGSDASFPPATHELVLPESMVDGAYGRNIENRLPADPQPDNGGQKGSTHYSADYTVTSTGLEKGVTFRTVQVYGSSGRYTDPEWDRDSLMRAMTVTGTETVSDPPRTIRVPGSDVDFRCETVDGKTVCGWGDANTTVAIEFTPSASLDVAAAETRKIRDEIRRPIATPTASP